MLKIERLSDPRLAEEVAELFNLIYPHKPIQSDYVRWRYLDNPFRSRSFVALLDGKVVGSYAGSVFPMKINGKTESAAFLMDAMVHPNHQNRGIILGLYGKILESFGTEGVHKFFAFANGPGSDLFCKGFGWKHFESRQLFVAETRQVLAKTAELSAGTAARIGGSWTTEHARLAETVILDTGWDAYVERTEALLDWRSRRTFGRDYEKLFCRGGAPEEAQAFCVFKSFLEPGTNQRVGDVVELFGQNRAIAEGTLHRVAEQFASAGVERMATWGFAQIPAVELGNLGFSPVPKWSNIIIKGWNPVPNRFLLTLFDTEMF